MGRISKDKYTYNISRELTLPSIPDPHRKYCPQEVHIRNGSRTFIRSGRMKHVASALSVGLWAAILATCYGWAFSDYRAPSRRSYNEDKCIGSGGKCYAS